MPRAITRFGARLPAGIAAIYYALGDHDVVLIVDMPDVVSGAALGLRVSSSGLVRTKTTALLTVEEADRALSKAVNYRAPGG